MTLEKGTYGLVTYRPYWMPFNDEARAQTATVADRLGLKKTGKMGEKTLCCVASLLWAAQRVIRNSRDDDHLLGEQRVYLGVQRRADAWSHFPLVGKNLGIRVFDLCEEHGLLAKVEGSGDRNWSQDEKTQRWYVDPIMTLYEVQQDQFPADLMDARFVEVGRPTVRINKVEARRQRERRKTRRLKKPVLGKAEAKRGFGDALSAAESRVEALNRYWLEHPLVLPDGHAAASATRVFHDSRLDAGGRFYGYWTSRDKAYRLGATIDGEQVCEIDIRGSQPVLLNSLLGYQLGNVSPRRTWHDVYLELLLPIFPDGVFNPVLERHRDDPDNNPEPFDHFRNIAKGVVMELIGTGNPDKAEPSDGLVDRTGVTQEEWDLFKGMLKEVIPALNYLEPRYDAKGNVSGYTNGPGFLSYHESEMILLTLERLMFEGVPAYPVHDCLLVKVSDVEKAAVGLRETISDYCKKLSGLEVLVAVTVEKSDGNAHYLLDDYNQMGIYPDHRPS